MDVEHLMRRAIHLRVLLCRGDQGRDPGRRVLDLVHQQLGLKRVVQPPHGAFEQPVVDDRDYLIQPADVDAGLHEGRRELIAAGDPMLGKPVSQLVLAVGGVQRRQLDEVRRLRGLLDCPFLQADQHFQRAAVPRAASNQRELVPHAGDPLAQR